MRIGTAALTLAFALGVAGFVAADEATTGSWWSRVPTPWAKNADAKKDTKDERPPGLSLRERKAIAEAALARRREACLRLQEIAVKLNDNDLLLKAEDLADRAFEAYSAALERIQRSAPMKVEPDLKNKEKRK